MRWCAADWACTCVCATNTIIYLLNILFRTSHSAMYSERCENREEKEINDEEKKRNWWYCQKIINLSYISIIEFYLWLCEALRNAH